MARKKKLNTRVVILLSMLGLAVVVGVVVILIMRMPKDPEQLIRNGDACVKADDFANAEKQYGLALIEAEKPAAKVDPQRLVEYFQKYAQLQLDWLKKPNLTQTEFNEHYGKAGAALNKALRHSPDNVAMRRLLTNAMWEYEALPTIRKGGNPLRLKGFAEQAAALVKLDDKDDVTWSHLAMARDGIMTVEGPSLMNATEEAFQKAVDVKPEEADYWVALASFYARYNEKAKAEEIFKKAEEDNRIVKKGEILVFFAQFLAGENRKEDARKKFQQVIDNDPNGVEGYIWMARFHLGENDLAKAQEMLNTAKKNVPTNMETYLLLAEIYGRTDLKKSVAILNEGLAALDMPTTATTEPARNVLNMEMARVSLKATLANIYLNMADANDVSPEDRKKLIADAQDITEKLASTVDPLIRMKMAGHLALSKRDIDEALKQLEGFKEKAGGVDDQVASMLISVYLAKGWPGKAMDLLAKIQDKDKDRNPRVYELKARIKIQLGEFTAAAIDLEHARRIYKAMGQPEDKTPAGEMLAALNAILNKGTATAKPTADSLNIWLSRADYLHNTNQVDEAITLLEKVNKEIPGQTRVALVLASWLAEAKRDADARRVLEEAKKLKSDTPADLEQINTVLALVNEPDPARRLDINLRRLDKMDDKVARAVAKARICANFNDLPKFEQYVHEAEEADKDSATKSLQVAQLQFSLALTKKDTSQTWEKDAKDAIERAKQIDLTGGRLLEAQFCEFNKDFKDAIAIYSDILRDRSQDLGVHIRRGECYRMDGQFERAKEDYAVAYSANPGMVPAVVGLAMTTGALGQASEHEKYVDAAYNLAPTHTYVAREWLRLQDERSVNPANAIKNRMEFREQNPKDFLNTWALAELLFRARQLTEAEECYLDAYKNCPDKVAGVRRLLQFYLQSGQTDKLINNLRQVGTLAEKDKVGGLVLQGDIYRKLGSAEYQDQAERAYEVAIDIGMKADPKDGRGLASMARLMASRGRYEVACAKMKEYIKINESADSRRELASYLAMARQLDEAGRELEGLLKKDPNNPDVLIQLAEVRVGQKNEADAQKLLDQAVNANPNNPWPWINRAKLYRQMGKLDLARADMDNAFRKASDPDQYNVIGVLYQVMGDKSKAEEVYREGRLKFPTSFPLVDALARIYIAQKNWTNLDNLIKEAKINSPQKRAVAELEIDSWGPGGRNQADKMADALGEAWEITSHDPSVGARYFDALIASGQIDRVLKATENDQQQDWVKAVRIRATAKKNPADAEKQFRALFETVKPADLQSVLTQIEMTFGPKDSFAKLEAWGKGSDDWQVLQRMAGWQMSLGTKAGFIKATELLNKAIGSVKEPQFKASLELQLATAYYQQGESDLAEQHYLNVLKVTPADYRCLNNLAYLYTDANKPEKALPYAKSAAELAPTDSNILDTYGWTLVKLGPEKYDEALRVLLQAAAEHPDPVCYYHLGFLYEQKKDLATARKNYETAQEMMQKDDANLPAVKAALDRVRK